MSSLVSEFIISPVLRQARRFSSGFGSDDTRTRQQGQDSQEQQQCPRPVSSSSNRGSAVAGNPSTNVILEDSEDGGCSDVTGAPVNAGAHASSRDPPPTRVASVTAWSDSARLTQDDITAAASDTGTTSPDSVQQPSTSSAPPTSSSALPQSETTPASQVARESWTLSETARRDPLPEDDGMGDLRRRIHAIQATDAPQEVKARMLHELLMEKYNKSQKKLSGASLATMRPESPLSPGKSILGTSPAPSEQKSAGPLQQALRFLNSFAEPAELNVPLTDDDLRPTYAPTPPPDSAEWDLDILHGGEDLDTEPLRYLGCKHYRRNVKMQCATCERWYTCRFCHDEAEDHVLPRHQTKHMLCMFCGCAQKVSDSCVRCGRSAAQYYCGICKLWNNDPNKPIYHCSDCGICRVGRGLGKDFFHCKRCMACISMSATNHKCIERSKDCDCPICGEYLFNSPKPVVCMECGHSIHRHCLEEHKKTSYKCPLCNKTCVNMETKFRNFDLAILTQPMPPEYRDARAVISCNDCSAKSQTPYHWLGLKCAVCNSYNTTQLQLLNMPGSWSEHDRQRQQETSSSHQQPVALDPEVILRELRRQQRAAAREREQRQSQQSEATPLSTSPSSSYSPAFLLRLLQSMQPFSSSSSNAAADPPSPPASTTEASSAALPASTTAKAVSASSPTPLPTNDPPENEDEEEEEEEEEDEDPLTLFGVFDHHDRSRDWSSPLASGGEEADEEEEEEESEEEEEEEEGEDEEDEILLVGHR